jgi:hypothetical protein
MGPSKDEDISAEDKIHETKMYKRRGKREE